MDNKGRSKPRDLSVVERGLSRCLRPLMDRVRTILSDNYIISMVLVVFKKCR